MKKALMIIGTVFAMSAANTSFATGFSWSGWSWSNFFGSKGGCVGHSYNASHDHSGKKDTNSKKDWAKSDGGHKHNKGCGHKAVPEIDAAGAAIAIALLGGVVSIARERRKKA